MNLGSLVAIAEITQFLALFQLLSLPFFPTELTQLYNSQSIFNFNFIPIGDLQFLPCSDMQSEDALEYNFSNHPSYNCISSYCNLISTFASILICHTIYFLTIFLSNKWAMKFRANLLWGSFISILLSDFINILVILLLNIVFVL